ncbi:hypothetical protein GPECTOR_36g2 [Gonium pectorale]|uniref:Uncharacterized protein n=1 Tax=Gonium pectorale TaxID=33097 RepID=A0A150GC02_GONPE|nr:hypothetical protein GPECTOR_36g2 [Gonium pectorale]|eukprot:KXZ47293.1 hypothetical protein GPECTOR_36g2 [Gonium pectorale]
MAEGQPQPQQEAELEVKGPEVKEAAEEEKRRTGKGPALELRPPSMEDSALEVDPQPAADDSATRSPSRHSAPPSIAPPAPDSPPAKPPRVAAAVTMPLSVPAAAPDPVALASEAAAAATARLLRSPSALQELSVAAAAALAGGAPGLLWRLAAHAACLRRLAASPSLCTAELSVAAAAALAGGAPGLLWRLAAHAACLRRLAASPSLCTAVASLADLVSQHVRGRLLVEPSVHVAMVPPPAPSPLPAELPALPPPLPTHGSAPAQLGSELARLGSPEPRSRTSCDAAASVAAATAVAAEAAMDRGERGMPGGRLTYDRAASSAETATPPGPGAPSATDCELGVWLRLEALHAEPRALGPPPAAAATVAAAAVTRAASAAAGWLAAPAGRWPLQSEPGHPVGAVDVRLRECPSPVRTSPHAAAPAAASSRPPSGGSPHGPWFPAAGSTASSFASARGPHRLSRMSLSTIVPDGTGGPAAAADSSGGGGGALGAWRRTDSDDGGGVRRDPEPELVLRAKPFLLDGTLLLEMVAATQGPTTASATAGAAAGAAIGAGAGERTSVSGGGEGSRGVGWAGGKGSGSGGQGRSGRVLFGAALSDVAQPLWGGRRHPPRDLRMLTAPAAAAATVATAAASAVPCRDSGSLSCGSVTALSGAARGVLAAGAAAAASGGGGASRRSISGGGAYGGGGSGGGGGGGGGGSLVLVGLEAGGGWLVGLYLAFPVPLPMRILAAVRANCRGLFFQALSRLLDERLRGPLAAEVCALEARLAAARASGRRRDGPAGGALLEKPLKSPAPPTAAATPATAATAAATAAAARSAA